MKKLIRKIKNLLKHILPPSVRAFNREVERLHVALHEQEQAMTRRLAEMECRQNDRLASMEKHQKETLVAMGQHYAEQLAGMQEAQLNALASMEEGQRAWLTGMEAKQQELLSSMERRQNEKLNAMLQQQNEHLAAMERRYAEQLADMKQAQLSALSSMAEGQRELIVDIARHGQAIVASEEKLNSGISAVQNDCQKIAEQATVLHKSMQEQNIMLSEANDQLKLQAERQKYELKAEENLRWHAVSAERNSAEAVWAEIFNNTIFDSSWLKDRAFSPGRWAMGYQALYVLYRILNETSPKRILELGLGQSTRLISQYAAVTPDVEHVVVEHDPEWIEFFQKNFELPPQTQIVQLEREMVPFREAEAVRVFKGFRDTFCGERFDVISVDAPLGGDMKQYSRIDMLSILPDCLSDDFVILVDDAERSGEARTIELIKEILTEHDVKFVHGKYRGKNDCVVFCAEHMGFLATL